MFEMDSNELYEQNILPFKEDLFEDNAKEIDDKFYENIPLNDIKKVKLILEEIKKIKTNFINYDFIKEKELIDTYINNTKFMNIEDKYMNEEESIEMDNDSNTEEKNEILNKNINKKQEEKEGGDTDLNIEEEHDNKLIASNFFEYKKKFSINRDVWWPINLSYGGKKYYPATHSSYLIKNSTTILKYFCVNHKLNTPYKRMIFNNNKCNGKIEYNRKTG